MAAASIELRFLKAARNLPGFEEVGLKEHPHMIAMSFPQYGRWSLLRTDA